MGAEIALRQKVPRASAPSPDEKRASRCEVTAQLFSITFFFVLHSTTTYQERSVKLRFPAPLPSQEMCDRLISTPS